MLRALFCLLLVTGCSGWTYNGINGKDLRNPTLPMLAGAATSIAVHFIGHVAYLESMGKDWHMDGLSEIVDGPLTPSQARMMGRIGFASQLGLGYGMKLCGLKNDFTKGYNFATVAQIATYKIHNPILNSGDGDDIKLIAENGGNGDLEWLAASTLGFGLLFEKERRPK